MCSDDFGKKCLRFVVNFKFVVMILLIFRKPFGATTIYCFTTYFVYCSDDFGENIYTIKL